jgi:Flp pilus assembly protein TadD
MPPSAETQRALARAYRAQGNQSAAISVLSAAAQSNPTDAGISLDLAQGFVVAGRMDEAQREYRRLLKMHPNHGKALNDLAYLLADFGGNLDEALSLARKGAQFAADASLKASVSDTLGWIYLKKQMYDSALQTFQNLVSTNPGNMTFRYHLGMTLYQMGSKARAKTELEAALSARIKSDDEPRIRELLARL